MASKNMRYRFALTFPITFSPHHQVHSMSGATMFSAPATRIELDLISPDLSLNDPARQDYSGGVLTHDDSGAEVLRLGVESPQEGRDLGVYR
ncbi:MULTISPECIES: hypothetical protein [unclassified Mesorhizobium]|uniref:hypothetical protein n=1 Tax=unclassified Mesorhizobium TaxID=325217 RepID=UPI000FE33F37|nr:MULTISPECIES: hypothetical protein [unclassified Mesorhizobium]RWQ13734.1 MAG: hypothetical protein EOR92_28980 [Mesorhizobium sp.]TGQ37805.1 hypothetical protein EN857_13830 [Mesorhizobium sp. M4B.F.Ca.ET.214.01.1.1]TGQ59572.1 hypothetical protein EN854_16560 [Mesorhizobium sp. M4B.F.Ca.ET.211.01.1.1]TGU34638.1 hypothetical protein EN793_16555 [Mesorhizobium sp. M4B.F.Ca.ET.150.01.1.1]